MADRRIDTQAPGIARLHLLAALSLLAGGSAAPPVAAQEKAVPVAAQETQFAVKAIRFSGNALIPQLELAGAVAPALGERRTLADLRRAAAAVQAVYRGAGFAGVVAYVPPQTPADGEFEIRVVEGKLAKVNITGNKAYPADSVRASVPSLRTGETPNVRRIDRDIQFANENSARHLRVSLGAGAQRGEIDAKVEVTESEPLQFRLSADNTGNEATGRHRLGVALQHANLWGRDHGMTLQFQTSPDKPQRVQVYSAGYRLPFYGLATVLDLVAVHSDVDNGSTTTPAGALNFAGKGDVFGLRLTHYLARVGDYDQRITAGIDWRDYSTTCSLGSFGAAGCGPVASGITVKPLVLAYAGQVERPQSQWGVHAAVVHHPGGERADFEATRPGAKPRYTFARLSAFANFAHSENLGLSARVAGQVTGDALIPGEQFGMGGAGSVRGYQERERAGDNGLFASVELHGPELGKSLDAGGRLKLRPLAFIDAGEIANEHQTLCAANATRCRLSSLGLGMRLGFDKWLTGRLDVGRTLQAGLLTPAGKTRGHFALTFTY